MHNDDDVVYIQKPNLAVEVEVRHTIVQWCKHATISVGCLDYTGRPVGISLMALLPRHKNIHPFLAGVCGEDLHLRETIIYDNLQTG